MPQVKFLHKTHGKMITTPENWINYELFDAQDEIGDTHPVYKSDCFDVQYKEE